MPVELDWGLYYEVTEFDVKKADLRLRIVDGDFLAEQELARLVDDERKVSDAGDTDFDFNIVSPEGFTFLSNEIKRADEVASLLHKSASACFKRYPDHVSQLPGDLPEDTLVLQTEDGTKITIGRQKILHTYVGKPRVETFLISWDVNDWTVDVNVGFETVKGEDDKAIAFVNLNRNNKPIRQKLPLRSALGSNLVANLDTAKPYIPPKT